MPTKHRPLDRSILGTSALVLRHLRSPSTISQLWDRLRAGAGIQSFDQLVMALTMLYAVGAVELRHGRVCRVAEVSLP